MSVDKLDVGVVNIHDISMIDEHTCLGY